MTYTTYINYKLDFYTQYHQFYIADKESEKDTADVGFWTDEASELRLAIGNGILGVGLECYGPFRGELTLLDKEEANVELAKYDHIVEGGLDVRSGIIQILDCPNINVELEVRMNPGIYRVRIYSMNLSSVVDGESGDDYYKIEMWPDSNIERVVLKQYSHDS